MFLAAVQIGFKCDPNILAYYIVWTVGLIVVLAVAVWTTVSALRLTAGALRPVGAALGGITALITLAFAIIAVFGIAHYVGHPACS